MNRSMTAALLGLSVALATGCRSRPEITRRYATLESVATPESPCADAVVLTGFVKVEDPPKPEPAVTRLTGTGQAELIRVLSKGMKPPEILRLLGRPLGWAPPSKSNPLERRSLDRRVVFSVERGAGLLPADRVLSAEIRLALPATEGGRFPRIADWDRFSTKFGDVDLGKVTLTQSDEAKATASVGPYAGEALPVDLELVGRRERVLEEELALEARRVELTGVLEPGGKRARVFQEGAPGIDLVGNSVLDLTVDLSQASIDERRVYRVTAFKDDDAPKAPADAEFTVATLLRPGPQAVTCSLSGSYVLRRVLAGGDTVIEGDDAVRLERGEFPPRDLVLVEQEEVARLRRYFVIRTAASTDPRVPALLVVSKPPIPAGAPPPPRPQSDDGVLAFETYEEGAAFLEWLRAAPWDTATPKSPAGDTVALGPRHALALSPDGRQERPSLAWLSRAADFARFAVVPSDE